MAIFDKKIDIRERCKGVHCVDLGESFQTHVYLQNLASIQPRTSPPKFGRSPRSDLVAGCLKSYGCGLKGELGPARSSTSASVRSDCTVMYHICNSCYVRSAGSYWLLNQDPNLLYFSFKIWGMETSENISQQLDMIT